MNGTPTHAPSPIVLGPLPATPDLNEFEIVERKGRGHPDTICDALAEAFGAALSRSYVERFGVILHHNVDKALLCAGASRPAFGGGEILAPMEIHLGGRATETFRGIDVPVGHLASRATQDWLETTFPELDFARHVRVFCRTRPGSADLVSLFARQQQGGIALANDTSIGVGFAPRTELERTVLAVDAELHSAAAGGRAPEVGADTKVMGVRVGGRISLTIACAFVDRHLASIDDYLEKKDRLAARAREAARRVTAAPLDVRVNAGDDPAANDIYLTVTGTSAEAGDDGQVGRGNRASGLITPFRPMSLEAVAGKNPVTHVGKLYNVVAERIAAALVAEIDDVLAVHCAIVSRIGSPVDEPGLVGLALRLRGDRPPDHVRDPVAAIARAQLERIPELRAGFLNGSLSVY
jgi:S-adenosylmethionine synthetase